MKKEEILKNRNFCGKTAGGNAILRVPVVAPGFSVAQAENYIRRSIKSFDTINYIYVVDEKEKLRGVISIKDLYRLPAKKIIGSLIKKQKIIAVRAEAGREEAANLALQHNIKAVPVLENGKFIGIIPNDKVLSILHREFHGNILQLAGVHKEHLLYDNVLEIPFLIAIRHRLPWLFIGLLGGIFAAGIIGFFEETLERNLILAAFIPLVVYMADAVGTQLEAFIIRDFAIYKKLDFFRYFFKQFLIVSAISVILGVVLAIVSAILYGDWKISWVLAVAIIGASMSSLITGLVVPFIFRRMKLDPANASGPIATIIQDILSVLIYFLIATAII
jgi:magnesium transporter